MEQRIQHIQQVFFTRLKDTFPVPAFYSDLYIEPTQPFGLVGFFISRRFTNNIYSI